MIAALYPCSQARLASNLEEFDGERVRCILLITHPPKVAIARLENRLTGVSSRLIRKNHPPTREQA